MPKLDNTLLLQAGLDLMEQNGMPLTNVSATGNGRKYKMRNGETVRIRTNNDHILPIVAKDKSHDPDAGLNIEGTDWLLIVMPEEERSYGKIRAYLIPTETVVKAAKDEYRAWQEADPSRGNPTRPLWFRRNHKAGGYAEKWERYLLSGDGFIPPPTLENDNPDDGGSMGDLQSVIKNAQERIARTAGVKPSDVKIAIEFG